MFTKQHYEAIANIIDESRRINLDYEYLDTDKVVERLADFFETDNERFDRDRFYTACYKRKS